MTDTSKEPPELLPCPFCGGDAGDTYYQLGWFISCKHCSASTEVTNAKARAVEAWNRRAPAVPTRKQIEQYLYEQGAVTVSRDVAEAAGLARLAGKMQSAPAVTVPQFNHSAKRKLNYLLEAGETITGYAFQNKDGRRGSIDCHGFVYWWQDAAGPVPQGWKLVPEKGTEAMARAFRADDAPGYFCMTTLRCADFAERYAAMLAAAPQPPEADHIPDAGKMVAAPAQLPEPPFWYCESKTPDAIWPIGRTTKKRESAFKDGYFNQQALYTEQQVRELLAAHGIKEQST